MSIEEKPTVAAALVLAETGMDFADALHPGKSTHCEGFAIVDRRLVKAAKAAGHAGVRVA